MIITIDGPSSSGKSTVARLIAQNLGAHYLSSGMLYRGLAYALLHNFKYALATIAQLKEQDLQAAIAHDRLLHQVDEQLNSKITFDAVDITPFLKTNDISQSASIISQNKQVRDALNTILRSMAKDKNIVAEGRDMGAVVFPEADLKFFLTASLPVRAHRLQNLMEQKGIILSLDEAMRQIQERDQRDLGRTLSPLKVPGGAIIIDNSNLSQEETVTVFLEHINRYN